MEHIIKDLAEGQFFCCREVNNKNFLYLNRTNGTFDAVDGSPASDFYFASRGEIEEILQRRKS